VVQGVMMVIGEKLFEKPLLWNKKMNLTSQLRKLGVQTIIFDGLLYSIMTKDCT
jgi:hypothetical protein